MGSRFARALGLIALAGLALRWAYAVVQRDFLVQGDAMTFHQVADHLAAGAGFIQPFTVPVQPTAEHPPLWELVLAGADLLGADGYLSHRLLAGLIGTVTVVLTGLLGRRVAGPRAGLLAAGIAAISPMLITADGSLMSETLYGALVAAALLAALAMRAAPSAGRAALVGGLIALAGLTRGEGLGLLALVALPLCLSAGPDRRRRAVLLAAAAGAFALVLAPWTIRNLTTFDEPFLVSTNANAVWQGANCPETYGGTLIGSWSFRCYLPHRAGEDESRWAARNRDAGLRYLREHRGRLPAVVVQRLGRGLDVAHTGQALYLNAAEGRPARPMRWAIRWSWLVMAFAAAGALLLRARRDTGLWILLAPVWLALALTIVTYGSTRFRHNAEPSLAVLAAVSAEWCLQALRARRAAPPPASAPAA